MAKIGLINKKTRKKFITIELKLYQSYSSPVAFKENEKKNP